jgi:hypothetical protein
MPLNGSGTFNRLYTWVSDRINGVKITDSRMDAEFDGIATALSSALYKDGQQQNAANQNWGGFRLTNLGDATAASDALNRQTGDARYFQRAEAEQTVASASTIDISADGTRWHVTGTTGITTITAGNNRTKRLRFSDAVTLTHNGTSLICPGGDDLTVAAGDIVSIETDGSGNVRVIDVYDASTDPDESLVTTTATQTLTNKTVNLNANTLEGTAAEFDAACSDDDFLFASDLLDEDDFSSDSATKAPSQQSAAAYISSQIGVAAKNYVVNPGMRISQENGTASGTASGYYPVDQFVAGHSQDGTLTFEQVQGSTPGGSTHRIRMTVTSADASIAAGQFATLSHFLEGAKVDDLLFGTNIARQIVLRFGWKSPAGTYAVSLRNAAANRSFVREFTISGGEANTDTVQTVTFPGDTTGTWPTGTVRHSIIGWAFAVGSTYQTTADSWQAGNYFGTSSTSNGIGTGSAVFELFDVGLYADREATGVAPPFILTDYGEDLRACQRYFSTVGGDAVYGRIGGGYAASSTVGVVSVSYPVEMRTVPAFTLATAVGTFELEVAGATIQATSVAATGSATETTRKGAITVGVASGLTAGDGVFLRSRNSTAAKLRFNARL